MNTIAQVREANRGAGFHFFDRDTMLFFDSRVLRGLYGGRFFVTSEKGPDGVRAYTVREASEDGRIDTVGEFQGWPTAERARWEIRAILSEVTV